MQGRGFSFVVFFYGIASDNIGVFEAHHTARIESEVFFWRIFHKVVLLDIQYSRKRHEARAAVGVFRIVFGTQLFDVFVVVIGNNYFERC